MSGKSFQIILANLIRIGCLLVAAVAIAVLFGWIFDIPTADALAAGLAFMKINTACALLRAASITLWILHTPGRGFIWVPCGRCLAALLVALGALTLSEHFFGLDLGIDQHIRYRRSNVGAICTLGRVSQLRRSS